MYGIELDRVPEWKRRERAERKRRQLLKQGRTLEPVEVDRGKRTLATTFWGKAWCTHFESLSDFENRLPRGRTYARGGKVLDLELGSGKVTAWVSGSSVYEVSLSVSPLQPDRWRQVVEGCAGQIDSLVELLEGRLTTEVIKQLCDPAKGLFPAARELRMNCSCPDHARLCKHVAAVLYGVGMRLDRQPELLFTLRQVEKHELIDAGLKLAPADAKGWKPAELEELFGIELVKRNPGPRRRAVKRKVKPAAPSAVEEIRRMLEALAGFAGVG